ncbi:MAG: hypothetical protein WC897_01215 [Candidatus Gracilibacteria bacterium]
MADSANPAMNSDKLFPGLGSSALEPQATVQTGKESKNVFTELFGNDQSVKNTAVLDAVQENHEKKTTSFFGDKPKVDSLSLKNFTKEGDLKVGSAVFKGASAVFVLVLGFFLSQNVASLSFFGVNPALRTEMLQEQINTANTEVRVQKYLSSALLLSEYSSLADEYIYNTTQANSAYTSQNKKDEFKVKAELVKPELASVLTRIKDYLSEPLTDLDVADASLTIDNLIIELGEKSASNGAQTVLSDVQDLETAKVLFQNTEFRTLLAGLPLEALTDEQIKEVYDTFSTINQSTIALIGSIGASRTNWSFYLDTLESLTKKVDPLFGTEFPGNIYLDDVKFNEDGTVMVSGKSNTSDTKNFTLVSNLIDSYEANEYFKNVEDRSYSKSNEDEAYTGSFRISMQLETNQ